MKILLIGDIIGKPGRLAVKEILPKVTKEHSIFFTLANVENSAGGFGVTPQVLNELFSYGIDVATSGNHIWDKKEIMEVIDKENRLLRPANYPEGVSGCGAKIYIKEKYKIAVLNLEGRIYLPLLDCPFKVGKYKAQELAEETKIIIVDFHAEITSEKIALGYYLDGDVTAVLGTHTHIQTADERILPRGTAYITDVGMTGPYDSVIGIKKEIALQRFLLHVPVKFEVANWDIKFCAVIVDVDDHTGKALSIKRIQHVI